MKFRLLPALLVLLPFFSMAQLTLKGRVIDEQTASPLQGAHLRLNNRLVKTTTDAKGMFEINDLKAGSYKLKVTYLGYRIWEAYFDLEANKSMLISLEQAPVLTQETIITATRAGDKTPVTYQNLSGKEISKNNQGRDIPFLLEQMPATVVTSDAGTGIGYTGIRIRGTDMNRINITVNGIPLNDAESHSVFWVNMPDFASSTGSLQVQRGVGTSTNGAAAFGASINLLTEAPAPEAYGEVSSAAGSFNTFRNTVQAGTGLMKGNWAVDARLSKLSSDGYIDRAFSDLKSFYVSGGYFGANTILKVNVFSGKEITYQAWDGIPSDILKTNRTYNGMGYYKDYLGNENYYDNETDNYQQDHYQMMLSQRLGGNLTGNIALHYTRGFGYYEQFKDDEDLTDYLVAPVPVPGNDTLLITQSDLIRRKYLDNDFYGFTWSVNYEKQKLSLTAGGSGNRYEGLHFGEIIWAEFAGTAGYNHRWYEGTGDKKDLNFFVKSIYQAGSRLSLYGDLQLRGIQYALDGRDDDQRDITQSHDFLFFNPKAGIHYALNQYGSIYAGFAVANREPNRDNYTDADPSKPAPVAETLFDYELGYNYHKNNLKLAANLYYMHYRDQLVLTGAINDVGAPVMTNVPLSFRTGLEISSQYMLTENLQASANLTVSSNKIKNFTEYVDDWDNWGSQIENSIGSTDIAFSPDMVAGAAINWAIIKNLDLMINGKYVSRQYIDNTSSPDRSLDPYFVSNLRLGYTVKPAFVRQIEFSLNINNLFNAEYETNAWIYRYYSEGTYGVLDGFFPQAGINFMAGLTLKL
ncbi:TonB-dependent receptor [Lentimicrobium sp.]|uniref:TonB-dependent receptor n=1 Tax=Lentimicrobium sp. TaxID=2034841 RepID=UPI002D0E0CE9|nr:TonB-dependent receptor [Lentimicrobium sp.]HPF65941.1 TonB-dependent receptor [Lentimicrobium sp.]